MKKRDLGVIFGLILLIVIPITISIFAANGPTNIATHIETNISDDYIVSLTNTKNSTTKNVLNLKYYEEGEFLYNEKINVVLGPYETKNFDSKEFFNNSKPFVLRVEVINPLWFCIVGAIIFMIFVYGIVGLNVYWYSKI